MATVPANNFEQDVAANVASAIQEINSSTDLQILDAVRVKYFGKQGYFTAILKNLANVSAEERPAIGQIINAAKQKLTDVLNQKRESLQDAVIAERLAQNAIDYTLPGAGQDLGGLHPITKAKQRMEQIFMNAGFRLLDDPEINREIEDDYHNFDALNIPAHHPSRQTTDTFYLQNSKYLLRTQTSPAQIRAIEKYGIPIKMIASGRVYRRDLDATHAPMFHQMEGLLIDEGVTFADLKGVLHDFLAAFFETKVAVRFRASYFPFTEPSAEFDMQCVNCDGKGCNVCKHTGWLEVGGCGMVHTNVLEMAKVDPEVYRGFAFGLGIDRFTMLRYGINDLRIMFENDLQFLEQF